MEYLSWSFAGNVFLWFDWTRTMLRLWYAEIITDMVQIKLFGYCLPTGHNFYESILSSQIVSLIRPKTWWCERVDQSDHLWYSQQICRLCWNLCRRCTRRILWMEFSVDRSHGWQGISYWCLGEEKRWQNAKLRIQLYHLDEKDTPTKLEILFKLNLYMLAINLAHMQKYDDASIAEIFKKYGDHLYS